MHPAAKPLLVPTDVATQHCMPARGILSKGRFLITRLVMVSWDSAEVVFQCHPGSWLGFSQAICLRVTQRIQLLLMARERLILTIIIPQLGPLSFLPRCFEATLEIWSERLAKTPYQKRTYPQRGSNLRSVDCKSGFYQPSYPGPNPTLHPLGKQ